MDANVATTELRIENGHADSQSSLTNRLGHLAKRVPPPMIADVWLFPPLPDVESSSEFLLFTRILEDGVRGLYSARLVPENGTPAHQVVVEHGRAPADSVTKLISGLHRRLGHEVPAKHVTIAGDHDRWQVFVDETREAEASD